MSRGWVPKSVDELAFVGRGKSRHRPRNEPSLYGGEHPFVQTAEIHNSDLWITTYSQTYSDKGLAQSKMWEPGTICITNAGENTGDSAVLGIRACFPDSVIAVIPDPNKADTFFLKYAIDHLKPRLRRVTRGATQDNLSVAKLTSFKFPTPPIEEQRRIGAVLRAYGDLIDNNHRRIGLLDDAMQMLYREWFCHLRFPGHEHAKIVNGVPSGWNVAKVTDDLDFVRGVEPGSKAYQSEPGDGRVPFFRVGDIGGRPSDIYIEEGLAKERLLSPEDVVVTMDGTPGLVSIGRAGAYSSGIRKVVRRDDSLIGWAFSYGLLKSDAIQSTIARFAKGTTILHASSSLDHMTVLLPPKSVMTMFEQIGGALLKQVLNLEGYNAKLMEARTVLLPRLMNGEVAV